MKLRTISNSILLPAVLACLWASACGSKSAANVVAVNVLGSFSVMVPTQSQTLTASVTGATDVTATFTCNYTTTPNPTTAVPAPKPSASATCESQTGAVGVLTPIASTSTTVFSTATFTAPKTFPDQVKLPNVLVTITATSHADTKKTGTFPIAFDSGIRITLVPATATLGTGEKELFLAKDFNGNIIQPDQLAWHVTFETTAKTSSADCSTGSNSCGSIDKTGQYIAPAAVPTAAPASTTAPVNAAGIVTVYAFSNVDNARIAQAAVTIVKAGDIAFTGISPTVAPQGALQQDIFLAATNATSQIGVTFAPANSQCQVTGVGPTIKPSQIKVIFAAGTTTASVGARVRLTSDQITAAGHYNIKVTSSNSSIKVTPPGDAGFCMDLVPVRPSVVSTTPGNFQESTLGQTGGVPFVIDGGFFGDPISRTVTPLVNGQSLNQNTNIDPRVALIPSARRIGGSLPSSLGGGANAGLFPVSVMYSTAPGPLGPPVSTTAYSNIAVIPDYGGSNAPTTLAPVALPPSSVPSAVALDSVLGYAVVTLAGANSATPSVNTSNNLQFINLAGGTPSPAALVSTGGFLATGVAVDDQLHVAAVVNYASRSLTVHSIPAGTLLGAVDLSGVIPPPAASGSTFVQPFPYSVGIDPFSHRALVAFASTNVGLIINLDNNATPTCLAITPTGPYCAIAYVTLSSGANPQIAFEAGAHLAYATPGGAGLLSAVDLGNPSKGNVGITSATRASNVVTVTTAAAHNLNPGNPGTVLISGLPKGATNSTNFDGSFSVGAVLDATHFQISQADKDDTSTCPAPTPPSTAPVCTASSGVPFLTYTISPSIVGIAINPVTRRAVLADANLTFSQITFLDPQSESVSSMTLSTPAGAAELGATTVAFQPFTNTAVSFNPKRDEISLLDPSALQRLKTVPTGGTGSGTAKFPPAPAPTTISVDLPGAVAVDSTNNLALVVNSGSSNISVIRLAKSPNLVKSIHIESVLTNPIDDPTKISVPANLAQAVKITSGVAPAPIAGVKIFGAGFDAGSQVRLDGVPLGNSTFVNSHEIDVTIPVSVPDPTSPSGTLNILAGPRHFALSVLNSSGVSSNVSDFTVLEEIPIPGCVSGTTTTPAAPGGVAIDEVHNLALVTNTRCNQVSVISLNPANNFGTILKAIPTGGAPTGVAVLPRLAITGQAAGTSGVAVVTNNSANTVSIIDLASLTLVAGVTDVAVGTAPTGVAIDQETNLAVVADTGSSTVSTIDLTPLTKSPIGTLTRSVASVDQSPIAVAIDPDRGTNGRGLAVVTCLLLNGGSAPFGALDGVDIGGATPVKLTSASVSGVQSTPTGIVFDPAAVTGTTNPGLFYAVSTQGNQITTFNPDTSGTSTIKVGINPTGIAYNFQTGTMLTVNALSNSISIVDSQTFQTKATLGIGGKSLFSAAIHTFTNLAVIADHDNNRVLLFPLPK